MSEEQEHKTPESKYKANWLKRMLMINSPVGILDWYIIRKFLGTFFFILVLLMAIAIIFDVSEKIDDFLKRDAPIDAILFDYYANFFIHYGNLFSFLIIFISVIFFTSKMAGNSEIVAILSGGISFNRMLRPYFIAATILAGLALYLNHFVLPKANFDRLAFEELYIKNPYRFKTNNIHREFELGRLVTFQSWNHKTFIAHNFAIEEWDGHELKMKMVATSAFWDTSKSTWHLDNYRIRRFLEDRETLEVGHDLDTSFNFKPSDFQTRLSVVSAMNYQELDQYIEEEKKKGSDRIAHYEIEKHQRTSFPFATYILTVIGVCVASRKTRGGIGVHLAIGLAVVMIYIFAMKITTVAATNAGLDPAIAVWIPNILFGFVALIFYRKAQK